ELAVQVELVLLREVLDPRLGLADAGVVLLDVPEVLQLAGLVDEVDGERRRLAAGEAGPDFAVEEPAGRRQPEQDEGQGGGSRRHAWAPGGMRTNKARSIVAFRGRRSTGAAGKNGLRGRMARGPAAHGLRARINTDKTIQG